MKKHFLWLLIYLLLCAASIAYASWSYSPLTAGQLSDLDEMLWLDVSDTSDGNEGTIHRQTFATLKEDLPFNKCFAINGATISDDFLMWKTPVDITITAINGVLLSGTSIAGGVDECDGNGTNCVAVDADINFNDNNNHSDDGSLSNAGIDANDWLKWHTTSVSSPGYLTVCVDFK